MIKNYLTIDVEDYFQVSAFEKICGPEKWGNHAPRVVENTGRLLSMLESYGVKATFFILGWTAEKFPELVAGIHRQGHEIACHSYYHRLVYNLSPAQFREDTRQAKDLLEQITGRKVLGYRAPSYSINSKTLWAFEILEELGFEFDSSIFPIYHDRYGMPEAPRFTYTIPGLRLKEYPLSTTLLWKRRIPIAGGGYFRLFPYWFVKRSLSQINEQELKPFIFYLHPWEIDPGQPRMRDAGPLSRFRHYVNLSKTTGRFERLLRDFTFAPLRG